jgi:tRNA threonylcarbamoyladenosine biosynthesis protein TsaB
VAVATADAVQAQRLIRDGGRSSAALARLAAEVLAEAGVAGDQLAAIGVTIGPGSFTGLRASIALAQGIGLGAAKVVVGVTLAHVFAQALPHLGGRSLWTAIDSRRGHVFIEHGQGFMAYAVTAIPLPSWPVAIAGDAAVEVAARLAARGADVMLTDARQPLPRHIARATAHAFATTPMPRPPAPLYIDPPQARTPAYGLRPTPS